MSPEAAFQLAGETAPPEGGSEHPAVHNRSSSGPRNACGPIVLVLPVLMALTKRAAFDETRQ